MSRKNNFIKAISHLKSKQIDEKINQLEEQPTNNTYGLMTVGDPSHTVQPPDIEVTELDFNLGNDDDDGKDTRGIFNEQGEILTIEPDVGDTSYILGPMSSMYYGWWSGGTSTIGYIRESDRKMVNLGTVPGVFDSWDGTTGFNSYGQLTLEQAQWFKNTPKKNDYRAFYPGPPSNTPDAFGRYLCQITGTPKEFEKTPPPYVTSPTQGPESASDQFSMLAFWGGKGEKDAIDKLRYDPNHPDGTNQPNPFEPGTTLYRNFEKQRAYDEHGLLGSAPNDDVKIAGAGGSPGQPYTPPKEDPNNPYVPAPGRLAQFPTDPASDATTSLGAQDGDKIAMVTKTNRFDSIMSNINKGKKLSTSEVDYLRDNGLDDFYKGGMKSTDPVGDLVTLGVAAGAAKAIVVGLSKAFVSQSTKVLNGIVKNASKVDGKSPDQISRLLNLGKNRTIALEKPEVAKALQQLLKAAKGGTKPNNLKDIAISTPKGDLKAVDIITNAVKKLDASGFRINSYKPQGMVLTESRKRILREIKKPYKVPKTPTKFKGIKPKVRVTGKGLMEVPEIPKQFKPEPTIWRKPNYDKNVKASQEKKNEVLEYVGAAADHWEYLTETRRKEKNSKRDAFYSTKKDRDFLYDYWYGGKKHKVTRQEEIDNDCLVYIEDEDGKKFSMLQSKLNEMLEEEKMKDMFDSYIPEEEQGEREKNFDKVTKLKSIVGKIKRGDIGPEYPNEPPPELVNGWHPKLGKKYKHDKLDPQSAEAMPDTGDPEIDANIKKATDAKSKARKLKTLLGKKA